jgi:hypothetical protein
MRFLSPDCDRQKVIEPNIMDDSDLTQLILRLWNEDLEISLSTRENENFVIIFNWDY